MDNGFLLRIVSPDGLIFDGTVSRLIVRTTTGDVCIMKNHAEYVATVDASIVRITDENGEKKAACVNGFLTVSNNTVNLVATTFEFGDKIDVERAKRSKEKAELIISEQKQGENITLAQMRLKRALLRIEASK